MVGTTLCIIIQRHIQSLSTYMGISVSISVNIQELVVDKSLQHKGILHGPKTVLPTVPILRKILSFVLLARDSKELNL